MRKFLAVLFVMLACHSRAADSAEPLAPNFSLRDINGELFTLSEHRGKIIVMNFWATWCNPCMAELPHLNQIDKDYEEHNVEVVAISLDAARHISKVKSYVKSRKYQFTTLLDSETSVVSQYHPQKSIPYTLILGRDGRIIYTHVGFTAGTEQVYINLLDDLLRAESCEGAE